MNSLETELKESSGGIESYWGHVRRKKITIAVLTALVFFLVLLSINAGAADINPLKVLKTLIGMADEKARIVIWRIRMPRVIAAVIAGAGLSVSGCVMQNNLKNPLASPSTLGISSAATFGANLAIIVFGAGTTLHTAGNSISISNPYMVTICAFVFSMGATFVILGLAKLRSFSPEAIILAGVALSSLFGAGTTIVQYFAPDVKIAAAIFWTFGDLGRVSWNEVLILSVVVIASIVYFSFRRWDYNALANGEETAKSLGVDTGRTRFWGLLVSSIITSVSVSFLGMIGFIGLIGPQIMIRIVGADYRFLIPSSALLGAVVLLIADTAARTMISPVVLPVGAITSLLGGPMFLFLLMRGVKR
ncbi:iron complex transport system permease protein [Dethiosulfatibacter aminovorans DSM 17477]|uniref:Iron complex transport system permease protein n=1 Tax=Dethiosulfatibacter aminovorans DSM 17477 TaxID=1121476 RepID=A0A1M6C3S9_9FIRM|nr:iron ABC transporter permease [Dethiosulfatibacter aminovorans]SHI55677.1 iron complex transport system permease protein [Dethiosulfatibacter aminovorans DSM 17477]